MITEVINLIFVVALIVLILYTLRIAATTYPKLVPILILLAFMIVIGLWLQILKFDFSWIPFFS